VVGSEPFGRRRPWLYAACSLVVHAGVVCAIGAIPRRAPSPPPVIDIEIAMVARPAPPPPPPPPPPPEPDRPLPVEPVRPAPPVRARLRATAPVARAEPPSPAPVNDPAPPSNETPDIPQFKVSMSSASQGTGPALPVGNARGGGPSRPGGTGPGGTGAGGGAPGELAVVPASEVTRPPLPKGRCAGHYTEAALAAAIEGVVVVDLIIDATGRVRDATVVSGLSHGLTEQAVADAKACPFTPAERNGVAVAVRLPGFKIRFAIPDAR
jgi:protein TonB